MIGRRIVGEDMSLVDEASGPKVTHRELEVLELVAAGYSAKEVAHQLGIAPRTVERHIENVRLKMRARNRAHMVTQAIVAGVLSLGPEPRDGLCEKCQARARASERNAQFVMKLVPED